MPKGLQLATVATCLTTFCLCCFEGGEMALQDTLEVFVESPEAAAPTKKLRKGLSKVFGRKDSDSEGEAECMDAASGVGEAEEALEGHLFSVGVAFAQVSSPCTFSAQLPDLLCNSLLQSSTTCFCHSDY